MIKESPQFWQMLDHPDTVSEHEKRVERPASERQEVCLVHRMHTAAGHHGECMRADINGGDGYPFGLQGQSVDS
jgi:hypothetical protein